MRNYRRANADGDPEYVSALDLELSPGFRVRDLPDLLACAHAIQALEHDVQQIASQIARGAARENWKARAEAAKRWKKRAIKAILSHAHYLRMVAATDEERLHAEIIKVIREELGSARMHEFVKKAIGRLPPVENSNNGEN